MPRQIKICIKLALIALLGSSASALALRDLGHGVVGCSFSETALSLNLDSYAFGSSMNLMPQGEYPFDATMTPNGREVWLTGASGSGVVVVDVASGAITQRIWVGDYPVSVAFSPDGSLALVSCRDEREIWRIDAVNYQVLGQTDTGFLDQGPANIALDPTSGCFYLAEWASNTLSEISPDGASVLRTVTFGEMFWQLVVSPDGTKIFVTDRAFNAVWVLDRASLAPVNLIDVGNDPWGLDISGDGQYLVVSSRGDDSVAIIEVDTGFTQTVFLNPTADPRDVDILDARGLAFVTGGWQGDYMNPVFVIDLELSLLEETIWVPEPAVNVNVIAVQAQMHGDGTDVVEAPQDLGLSAYPNPFNPKTEIKFTLESRGIVNLAIFDTAGRRQRTLCASEVLKAGAHSYVWDGRDVSGTKLGSGVYLLNLQISGISEQSKLVLLK